MDQEIIDYIIQAQKHGLAEFEIKQNLLNAGWDAVIVEENFVFAKAAENRPAPVSQNEHQQTSEAENLASSILPKQAAEQAPSEPKQNLSVSAVHPNLAINESTFKSVSPRGNIFKNKVFWIALVAFVIFGGTAYGYYTYFYITPSRVLSSYLNTKKPAISKINYELSYSFNYQATEASSSQPVTLTLSGDSYSDLTSSSSPEGSGNVKFSGTLDTNSVAADINYLLLNNIFYLYIGDIKKEAGAASDYPDWLKLDLNQTQKTLEKNGSQNSTSLLFNNPTLIAKIKTIAQSAKIIKTTDYLAKEQINGINTYHIQNQLDTTALNKLVSDIIDAVQNDPSYTGTKITTGQKQILSSLVGKFQLKNFDLWIGQKDHLLYKVNIVTNFPSYSDLIKSSLIDQTFIGSAKEKSREAKRLADVRQIAAALSLFNNDKGGYPEGIAGKPQNFASAYLMAWPKEPTPADGTCTDYYNTYWYKSQGAPKIIKGIKLYPSYTLTFCLGSDVGGYKAGIGQLTEIGIKDNITCPTTADLCVYSKPAYSEQDIQNAINQISFNDEIKLDVIYSDYGKSQKLVAPVNPQDILDLINQSLNSLKQYQATTSPLLLN